MLPDPLRQEIIALVREQVVPAIGCTEPVCVALAAARAAEVAGRRTDVGQHGRRNAEQLEQRFVPKRTLSECVRVVFM